jgi:hypothetical protein
MGAVKDGHLPPGRRRLVIAPQKIMRRFLLGGNLKARDRAALGIHGPKHMVNGAVLAGGVPSLQTDEQRTLAFRVHQVLQVMQLLTVGLDLRQGMLMGFMLVRKAGIDLAEIDLAAWRYAEFLEVVHGDHLCCLLVGNTAVPGTPRTR